MGSTDDWLSEITAQARKAQSQVFSVSVPLASPLAPQDAPEYVVTAVIEGVEAQNWQLDSVSTYGSTYQAPQVGPVSEHWALLVFRTTYR
ncbi:hypothetical protein [Streptomyces phaeochromogenes]|uniref:hypothetical protein n=1 Tax=Streptomyces phaeochromogenes TaxID=1923 RepID=UPI003721B650